MSRLKTPSVGLAAALAGIYLVLAAFSMACAFDHANPTSDAAASALVLHPFLVVALFVERDHTVIAGGAGFHAASRAPPVQS